MVGLEETELEILVILGPVPTYRNALTILDKFIKPSAIELWT
jgi:hypothetical protein